jgi:hypothetical protein
MRKRMKERKKEGEIWEKEKNMSMRKVNSSVLYSALGNSRPRD